MRIVSVSGACSRAGETTLAESLLRALPRGSAAAVKFTTTEDVFERCPRGSVCVVCDIDAPFRIVRDPAVLREPGTDTDRLAAAGAREVVWAIARAGASPLAWAAVARILEATPLAILEGSTVPAPSSRVVDALDALGARGKSVIADATRPLREWAPDLEHRLHGLAGAGTAVSAAS